MRSGVVRVGAVANRSFVRGDAESVVSAGILVQAGVVSVGPDSVGVKKSSSRQRVGAVGVEDIPNRSAESRLEEDRR